MKSWNKKVPKLKKGAWFVRVRHSYLPMTPQAWLMHAVMVLGGFDVLYAAHIDTRSLYIVVPLAALQLIGLGAIFTWIASHKS